LEIISHQEHHTES